MDPSSGAPWGPAGPATRVERAGEVLALIRSGRARTIAELAAAMGVARSTVVQRVGHLVADGLVESSRGDQAEAGPARGRPAAILRFNPGAGVVLVAQLGITGTRVAATDLDGALLAEHFEPFPIESGPEAVTGRLEESLLAALAATGQPPSQVRGVGIGVPRSIELSVGLSAGGDAAPALVASWSGFPLRERLQAAFGVPVFVDYDVNLLALGEQRSAWPGTDVLLCVKVGSVIGCGTVVHGELVRGAQGLAGNIGHIAVPGNSTPCACGNRGCLDAVAGGRALVTRLRADGLAVRDVPHLVALAREGAPAAVQAIRVAGRQLGEVLAYAVNLLNPGVVAVWGYLANAEAELLAGIRESVYQRSLPSATQSLQLVRARLGEGAGLVGAAMIVASHILEPAVLDDYLTGRAARSLGPGRAGDRSYPPWRQAAATLIPRPSPPLPSPSPSASAARSGDGAAAPVEASSGRPLPAEGG
jgi:predicted NBD/HSP70 family sugar kinase